MFRSLTARLLSVVAITLSAETLSGCAPVPRMLPAQLQRPIDRSLITGPKDSAVIPYIRGLTAPTAIAWNAEGSILIAEGGNYDDEPRIIGFKKDGSKFQIYPYGRRMFVDIGKPHFTMYGPIGGMVFYNGLIYVSHRDEHGIGMISALDLTGGHTTIAKGFNARGDFSITDLAVGPKVPEDSKERPRLYFGVGAATNSGVVGIDNWSWVRENPEVHDLPWPRLHLLGYRFDSPNPFSGLFGPGDIAVTAPFQAFNVSNQSEVKASDTPNAAIYSCSLTGGDVQVEAHGIRNPVGLAYDGFSCYFTNQGMKLRGTRPIMNDRDSLLRLITGAWYGWPDYTTDLLDVSDPMFQPPAAMIARTGYFRVSQIINTGATTFDNGGYLKSPKESLSPYLFGKFPPLSGAAKMSFVPSTSPLFKHAGKQVIVALSGDEAPFDTSGHPFDPNGGYKVVEVDVEQHKVIDFLKNTAGGPGSRIDDRNANNLLERPFDPKFGPDGALYILDIGRLHMHGGRPVYEPGTGKIFRVVPQAKSEMFHD